jgi:GxxExxY protein
MVEILYKDESYRIIGSCIKVHTELGPGFVESVYQEALEKQFIKDGIPSEREKLLHVFFDGQKLKKHFKADFVCFESIIVELKAASLIHSDNIDQTRSYLKSTNFQLGILVNFGQKSLTYKRILNSRNSCNSQ